MADIFSASGRGDTEAVERFIREGSDVNKKDYLGNSLIHLAARDGQTQTDTVKFLLAAGANPYITNKSGKTARDVDTSG